MTKDLCKDCPNYAITDNGEHLCLYDDEVPIAHILQCPDDIDKLNYEVTSRNCTARIKAEQIIKTYKEDCILIETVKEFNYDSKEDREMHMKIMQEDGFECDGQIKENIGTVYKPEYVYFGHYYKCETVSK